MATPDEFAALVARVAEWMENMADQLEQLMPALQDARSSSVDLNVVGFERAEVARSRLLAALREPIDVTSPGPPTS